MQQHALRSSLPGDVIITITLRAAQGTTHPGAVTITTRRRFRTSRADFDAATPRDPGRQTRSTQRVTKRQWNK